MHLKFSLNLTIFVHVPYVIVLGGVDGSGGIGKRLVLILAILPLLLVGTRADDLRNDLVQYFGNSSIDEIVAVLLHKFDNLGRFVGDDLAGVLVVISNLVIGGNGDSAHRVTPHHLALVGTGRLLEKNLLAGSRMILFDDVLLLQVVLHHLVRLEVGVGVVLLLIDIDLLGPHVGDESKTNLLLLFLFFLVLVVLLLSTAGHHTGLAGTETREREEESLRRLRRQDPYQDQQSNATGDNVANPGWRHEGRRRRRRRRHCCGCLFVLLFGCVGGVVVVLLLSFVNSAAARAVSHTLSVAFPAFGGSMNRTPP